MALYAIGDLHLCLGAPKPMDIFGGAWVGYMDKLREGLSVITEDDTTILLGDLSWSLDLPNAKADFAWINEIPGKKIILKGNHDYWWTTRRQMDLFFEQNGYDTLRIVHNDAVAVDDKYAVCGTRGWMCPDTLEDGTTRFSDPHDEKIFQRELGRLKLSLDSVPEHVQHKIVMFHYPPVNGKLEKSALVELMQQYGVDTCLYGHLHSYAMHNSLKGEHWGIDFHLVSADYLGFMPKLICEL